MQTFFLRFYKVLKKGDHCIIYKIKVFCPWYQNYKSQELEINQYGCSKNNNQLLSIEKISTVARQNRTHANLRQGN